MLEWSLGAKEAEHQGKGGALESSGQQARCGVDVAWAEQQGQDGAGAAWVGQEE